MRDKKFSIMVSEEVLEWLKIRAIERAYETKDLKLGSVSGIISEIIEEYIIKDNKMKLRADKAEKRKKEALERKAISDALTPDQKLAKLDEKLGPGVGANKERTKLKKILKDLKKQDKKKPKKADTKVYGNDGTQ